MMTAEKDPDDLAGFDALDETIMMVTPDNTDKKRAQFQEKLHSNDELIMHKNDTAILLDGTDSVVTPEYSDSSYRKESFLDLREKSSARRIYHKSGAVTLLVATDTERRTILEQGIELIKYHGFKVKARPVGERVWIRLEDDRIVWSHLRSLRSKVRAYFRSDSSISLRNILRVSLGPDEPQPGKKPSVISIIHAHTSMGVFSKWAYLTISTEAKDFIFGFLSVNDNDDVSFVRLLYWALSLEKLADASRKKKKQLGEGVFARAQKRYYKYFYDRLHEAERNAPLSRLCPALLPLAFVCAQTIESNNACLERLGTCFGRKAPDELARKASWLPIAVIENALSSGSKFQVLTSKSKDRLEGCVVTLKYDELPSSLDRLFSYCDSHNLSRPSHECQFHDDRRLAVTGRIPKQLNSNHLFAAIAKQDADMVEALILKGVSTNVRWQYSTRKKVSEWRSLVGEERAYMMPTRGTTPLNYTISWIQVIGMATTARLVKRLCDLRANPNLDDRQAELSLTPLAQAIITGSTEIVSILLKAGALPALCIGDGRSPLHLLPSVNDTEARKAIFHLIINSNNNGSNLLQAIDPATGDSPLHVAAQAGCIDLCTVMINYGADKFFTNDYHLNAADSALKHLAYIDEYEIDFDCVELKKSNILQCISILKDAMRLSSPRLSTHSPSHQLRQFSCGDERDTSLDVLPTSLPTNKKYCGELEEEETIHIFFLILNVFDVLSHFCSRTVGLGKYILDNVTSRLRPPLIENEKEYTKVGWCCMC